MSWIAIGLGAALGAWLRWGLHLWLNTDAGRFPFGTLAANLIGAYAAGLLMAFFIQSHELSPAWRLFAITGLLGGLTTFSTFSIESMLLLQRGELGTALAHTALHLVGSVALCFAGYATYRAI
jgi:CrcB protein